MSKHVGSEALFSIVRKNTGHVPKEAHIISNAFMAFASATAPSSPMALRFKVQKLDGLIRLVNC